MYADARESGVAMPSLVGRLVAEHVATRSGSRATSVSRDGAAAYRTRQRKFFATSGGPFSMGLTIDSRGVRPAGGALPANAPFSATISGRGDLLKLPLDSGFDGVCDPLSLRSWVSLLQVSLFNGNGGAPRLQKRELG